MARALTTAADARHPAPGRVQIPSSLWPLAALSFGLPPLYLLGLASVSWALPGIVFGGALLRQRGVRYARGSGLLLALVLWIGLTGVQLRGLPSLALFGYRWSLFVSLAITFVWICHVGRDAVPDEAIIRVVAWMWPVLMGFGYMAILMPRVSVPTPFLRVLPGGLASHSFIVDIASIRFAELQGFLGYPVPRPSAPFAYANSWGSAAALTFPFFVLDRFIGQPPARRRTGMVLLIAGLIPSVVSLNRGLWLSCGLALAYVAGRRALTGDLRTFVRLIAAMVLAVVIVLASPLGSLVNDRIEGAEDSNESRTSVARSAVVSSFESPLLGHGAPGQGDEAVFVGTHGLLWYLMYSHGLIAAALFLAWLVGRLRVGLTLTTPMGLWMTAVLVMTLLQMTVYTMHPHVTVVGVAAALVWRQRYDPDPDLAPTH